MDDVSVPELSADCSDKPDKELRTFFERFFLHDYLHFYDP